MNSLTRFIFCRWISSCFSTTYWKDHICYTVLPLLLYQRSVDCIYVNLFLGSLFCPSDLFSLFFHYNFIQVLKSGSVILFALLQCRVAILGLLPSHINFRLVCHSHKITCWDFWDCIESKIKLGITDILIILSSYSWTWHISFYLLCYLISFISFAVFLR